MLGARMRRGMRSAAAFASSSGHVPDMPVSLVPTLNENILELKARESTIRGQEGVRKDNFRIREWLQLSSTDSRHLTTCFATSPGDEEAADKDPLQKYQRRYGLSDAELGKIINVVNRRWKGWTHPDVDSTLTRLQDKLDLSDGEMRKILVGAPNVLGYGGSQDTMQLASL